MTGTRTVQQLLSEVIEFGRRPDCNQRLKQCYRTTQNAKSSQPQHQVQSTFLLDVVVRKCAAILQLLACEDQALLVRGDALLVLDLRLDVVNGVTGLDVQCDGLARQGLHEDLHATSQPQHQVQSTFLLDVVVRKCAAILQLLAGEDQALLVGGDALLVLDLRLDVVNGVTGLDVQCDGLARQGLHKDLHATSQPQHQVQSTFLLDVVVRKCAAILQLLACEDQALLVGGDALLVLDLRLDVVNGVTGLDVQCDGLARQGLHEDLHATSQPQHQVQSTFLLDVVVRKCAAILQLLACEDQALLVGGDALLVLDLRLDVVNGITGLDVQCDGLASQGLHKDLHATSQPQHQVQSTFLLDVVVRKCAAILQLLACEDQALLVGGDALLVLDLRLDVVNGVTGLDVQCDGLARQGLHKDLHATSQPQHQVQSTFLLDVVVRKCAAILQLLACEDQALLVGGDALLVLDLRLDVVNGVTGLDVQCDGLARQGLHKDLHATSQPQHQVQSTFLLDVVVRKCAAILQLLACEDQALLVGGDALLVLDLRLDVVNGVTGLDVQCDGLARQGLHENLHATSQPQHQVQSTFLLDVVVRKCAAILQLLACEDQALLVGGDALLVLDLRLDVVNGVTGLDVQCDGLARQGLHKDLHATSQPQHQVQSTFLLDVVVRKCAAILQLLACEDQALLVGGDALLVLDLRLDVVNGVTGLDVQCDGLARQGLHKDLHATSQPQHQVQSTFLLDVVVRKCAAILQLLACEDQALLVGGDALLVLDLRLDVVNGVTGLDVQCDGLACQGLHKDLHATSQPQHQVQSTFLLDVVVRKCAAILQLLACEDQALLVGGDALLVLDLRLDVVNGVTGLDVQCDGLARQGLHEDLHATSQPQHQVQSTFLLDVVVRKCAAILQLLACEDQALLVGGDALLVLDLRLDVVNGVTGLDVQCDGLARQGLHKDLHATSQPQHQVQSTFLLDVVVRKCAAILQLLACEDQALLVGGDALLVLDLRLDVVNGVTGLDVQCDGLARQGLHEDLHDALWCRIHYKTTKSDFVVLLEPQAMKRKNDKDMETEAVERLQWHVRLQFFAGPSASSLLPWLASAAAPHWPREPITLKRGLVETRLAQPGPLNGG